MQIDAAGVRAVRFHATKFREGYDQDEVDDFLDLVVAALEAADAGEVPGLTADDVLNHMFQATKFREGYDQDEVDDFLDRVVLALRVHEAERAEGTPSSADEGSEAEALDEVDGLDAVDGDDEAASAPLDAAAVRAALGDLRPRRLRPGYDPAEVTELLQSAAHALDLHARGLRAVPGADAVARTRLTPTWWAPGVDRGAVDALVDDVVVALRS
ncbi:DivIVA domain-containing protein [Cellulomonas endophytica]|uniref:DivIVA domain-containing protein n=1 Tax=Cellulomonas endophytica TaxID=2494735 RepID=UPI0010137E5F|nr:DivIVA domain-containing protein [Cellulomonas endophytica]